MKDSILLTPILCETPKLHDYKTTVKWTGHNGYNHEKNLKIHIGTICSTQHSTLEAPEQLKRLAFPFNFQLFTEVHILASLLGIYWSLTS